MARFQPKFGIFRWTVVVSFRVRTVIRHNFDGQYPANQLILWYLSLFHVFRPSQLVQDVVCKQYVSFSSGFWKVQSECFKGSLYPIFLGSWMPPTADLSNKGNTLIFLEGITWQNTKTKQQNLWLMTFLINRGRAKARDKGHTTSSFLVI